MKRYDCMLALGPRLRDELVILSLGGSVDEWYNAAPHMRAASLFQQQLGCVTPEAFGLACGLPHRRIVSLDTDGGLMFNLGILATLGNEHPANLFVVVWDNECYQSIGGPPTHTASGRVDLAAIARGCGVEHAYTARTLEEFDAHCAAGLAAQAPYVVVAKVAGSVQPGIKRKHSDGREDNTSLCAMSRRPRTSSSWDRANTIERNAAIATRLRLSRARRGLGRLRGGAAAG